MFGSINLPLAFGYDGANHSMITFYGWMLTKIAKTDDVLGGNRAFFKQYGISISSAYPQYPRLKGNLYGHPSQLLAMGAKAEDDGWRCLNHFYNPVWSSVFNYPYAPAEVRAQLGGLHDKDVIGEWFSLHKGKASMRWASNDSENDYSWEKARDYWYNALTQQEKDSREKYIGETFYSLGHVMHLIQDASVPVHARNDAHPRKAPYESWVKDNLSYKLLDGYVTAQGITGGIDYKQLVADQKPVIEDFFDAEPRGGDFSNTTSKGMAEFTNFNFYSYDTVSRAAGALNGPTQSNTWHRFRYPRLETIPYHHPLGYFGKKCVLNLQEYVDPFAGTFINHSPLYVVLGRHAYSYYLKKGKLPNRFNASIDYKEIQPEYARRLLPKAVAYSVGAVDFFFRGKLNPGITFEPGSTDGGTYYLNIQNLSGEPLGPGTIEIYSEDFDHDRTKRLTQAVAGPIADQGYIPQITFTIPEDLDAENGFMLVYKGTLGDEEDIAVIGQQFNLLRVNITWEDPWAGQPDFGSDQDLYMRAPDNSIIAYYRPDTMFGQLDYDDVGGRGPENITHKELNVPGDYTYFVDYYSDWWRERQYDYDLQQCVPLDCPPEEPTPAGINNGDDSSYECFCNTRVFNKVRTYFNSYYPVRTQQHPNIPFLREADYNSGDGAVPATKNEGKVNDSWWAVQSICVDDNGNIFITGVDGQTEVHYNSSTGLCE